MEDSMKVNSWTSVISVVFLAGVLSSCAAQRDAATPMASGEANQPAASTDFGGQPKDQEARERHHRQYPESAQHLGPQEDRSATNNASEKSSEQAEQERAAVSGVGK